MRERSSEVPPPLAARSQVTLPWYSAAQAKKQVRCHKRFGIRHVAFKGRHILLENPAIDKAPFDQLLANIVDEVPQDRSPLWPGG